MEYSDDKRSENRVSTVFHCNKWDVVNNNV